MADTSTLPPFAGFPAEAVGWFIGLERDNSRAYFTAQREVYEQAVRRPLEALVGEIAGRIGGRVKLSRPQRDIRFSRDKSPYKTNAFAMVLKDSGEHGLYVAISAQGLYVASGVYELAEDQLNRYRAAVDDETSGRKLTDLVQSLRRDGFEIGGAALKGPPRGFPRDHPRGELLRHKGLYAGRRLAPGAELEDRHALQFARDAHERLAALAGWLGRHVGPSTIPPEARLAGRRR